MTDAMTANSKQQTATTVYRVLSAKLRVQRGPGREDLVVARPVAATAKGEAKRDRNGNVSYLDSDEAPTLVEFDEHCQVNIAQLLRIGAIVPWVPPPPAASRGKGPRPIHDEAQAAEAPPADSQGAAAAGGEQARHGGQGGTDG